ncbi:MAG: hypothetical protein ACD_77C00234G0001, partial [uncultured bacterium]
FKSIPNLTDIPVILLTSLQESKDIIKGLQAGANNIITKPYDEKSLLQRIENLLSNQLLSPTEVSEGGLDVKYRGELHHIMSGKKQILDLLLSVYETSLQRNEELESAKTLLEKTNANLTQANNDLDCISKTVSHDLNSKIDTIIGSSRDVLNNSVSKLNTNKQSDITYILECANEMSHSVKDLLAFVQSGYVEISEEDVELSKIAQEAYTDSLPNFSQLNPTIEIEPEMHARADSKMVRILLDNLFHNALQYCKNIDKPIITIGQKEYYGSKLYFIKDNGAGLDTASLDNLFKPSFQYQSGEDYSSSRLGLSTVKRIVDKHKGQIWVESEIGKGSTFFFTLG